VTPLCDERSLEVLDFFRIRDAVAAQCATDRGAALARSLVPAVDFPAACSEQAATAEMRGIAGGDAFALPRVRDARDAVVRAGRGGVLSGEELRDVGIALAATDAALRRIRASTAPTLHARFSRAVSLLPLAAAIDRAIGERGDVLDRASPALARLRRNAAHAQEDARDRCATMLRAPRFAKAIQDAIVTVRDGRFVIPVKAEFAGLIPGVVHDTSSTGHTLFVEPLDALELNNRLRTLRLDEEREVARVLAELSALLGAKAEEAEANLATLADIDLVLARARVAGNTGAMSPVLVDRPHVTIVDGRHPLLGDHAVPQSLQLDDVTRFIVISGPNMGGKTVALKMLGLFVAMTYCGLQLPALEGTTIGAFDNVGCDIGDDQSIAENASTFSAHLRRLRTLVEGAGPASLVLVDEIASGTEPAASAALAIAIVEYLVARGARGIVTTHSTELKLFAHATAYVVNASVRFDPRTYRPTYELDLGSPGRSLAFPLARTLGLDASIVGRAEDLLTANERDYDRALGELAEIRADAAAERDRLARERAELSALESRARERNDALERERRTLATQAGDRLGRALREFTAELERRDRERSARPKVTSGQAALLGRVLDDVHRDLGIRAQEKRPPARGPQEPAPAALGDRVYVESLGGEGDVVEDYGRDVLVQFGAMRTVAPKASLRVVRHAGRARSDGTRDERRRSPSPTGEATLRAAASARTEIDVRGKRFAEAEPLVDRWIDQSSLLGLSPLRLIHGKGTGLLGRGLQEWLRGRNGIRDVRYGNADEGGGGVTIFELA